jgi:hypothetical protein
MPYTALTILLLLSSVSAATVTLSHLQTFFNVTYDQNRDGYATLQ